MEVKIINYIEVSGECMLFDELPEESKRDIVEAMQERAMSIAGYKRKTA